MTSYKYIRLVKLPPVDTISPDALTQADEYHRASRRTSQKENNLTEWELHAVK
jgi:hypothetical protein